MNVSEDGHITVTAVMFEEGTRNAELDKLLKAKHDKENEAVDLAEHVNFGGIIPAKHDYYRFSGSLTTPPCSEGVTWIVFKQPEQASKAQLKQFEAAFHHGNARPTQPLNGRLIIQ